MIDEKLKGVRFVVEKDKFGDYIKAKRLALNLTQEDLAEKLYISATAVSKWENGKAYPDITLISQICHVLDISAQEFISACDDTEMRKIEYDAGKYRLIKKGFLWTLSLMLPIPLLGSFVIAFAFVAVGMNMHTIVGLFFDVEPVHVMFWRPTGFDALAVTLVVGAGMLYISWLSWIALKKYMMFISRS
jgi:transcriptional regulator with XRE-family HTH domain